MATPWTKPVRTLKLVEWGEPRDMRLAPRDGRQIILLLSNGWVGIAQYPEYAGCLHPRDRWNIWWRISGISDVIDPTTIKTKPTGLYPLGWWIVPNQEWLYETAERLKLVEASVLPQ
jgi:hypothetical protein